MKLDPEAAARVFHALSDPTRIRVLLQLRQGERCVCELCDVTEAAQSRLSFHLKVLRDAGLLEGRKEGRWMYYAVKEEELEKAQKVIEALVPAEGAGASCRC